MDRIIFLLYTSNKKMRLIFFEVLPYMEKSLHSAYSPKVCALF
jgi:hypothetical protein